MIRDIIAEIPESFSSQANQLIKVVDNFTTDVLLALIQIVEACQFAISHLEQSACCTFTMRQIKPDIAETHIDIFFFVKFVTHVSGVVVVGDGASCMEILAAVRDGREVFIVGVCCGSSSSDRSARLVGSHVVEHGVDVNP